MFPAVPTKPATDCKMPSPKPLGKKPAKINYNQLFKDYLKDYLIINDIHYDEFIKSDPALRELQMHIRPSDLEWDKKTAFRTNFLITAGQINETLRAITYEQLNPGRLCVLSHFLRHVAACNGDDVSQLINDLAHWILNLNHKKKGLIIFGPSNTGKSLLLNLLASVFAPHEVGFFQCPMGANPSNFMFQNCANTRVYVCNEMIFENINLVQVFKELFEGSKTMETDVKHKAPQRLDPNPVGLTMNADSRTGCFKYVPKEASAFDNRALFPKLEIPLPQIYNGDELAAIANSRLELGYLLQKYLRVKPSNNTSFGKYADFIL